MKMNIFILSLFVAGLIVACGSKDGKNYKSLYEAESIKTANKDFENNSLKLALASYDDRYKDSVDLSQYTTMSTGGIDFNDFNNQIYLSSKIKFEQQDAIQNSIKLNLLPNISISPTDSWVIKTNTARTDFSNKSGIYGNIEIYKVYDTVAAEFIYNNFMEPFLQANNLGSASLQYLFIGNSKSGVEATSKVNIASTDTSLVTKAVDIKNLYDKDKLNDVRSEIEKANKVKEDTEKSNESLLEMELKEKKTDNTSSEESSSSETSDDTSKILENSSSSTEETTETILSETNATDTSNTSNKTSDISSETSDISSKTSDFIDVQVPEYKTTTSEYMFRVGIIMNGENAIVYKFLYKNNDSVSSNKEILDSLISSMQVDSMNISMEK